MPVYFGPIAPSCPLSHDEPVFNPANYGLLTRTSIPPAADLPSALAAANFARDIIQSITSSRTVNNIFNQTATPNSSGSTTVGKDQTRLTHAQWAEQPDKRVKGLYKYYATNPDGSKDPSMWVIMERIEQMVWYDPAWNAFLTWRYGDKGEGERVDSIFPG